MTWYLWLASGFVSGFVLTVVVIVGFAYTVMRSQALQQKFMSKMMRHMMRGSGFVHAGNDTHAST